MPDRSAVVHRVVVVVAVRVLLEREPSIPTRRDVRSPVLVQVLADQPRAIAGVVEPRGERRRVMELLESAIGEEIRVHAGGVRVLAGEDAGPAGTAQGVDD